MGIIKIWGAAFAVLITAISIATDTKSVNDKNQWSLDVRGAFHRSDENRTYISFDGRIGAQQGWEVGLRGTFAKVGNANGPAVIRTGGSDFEFMVRHAVQSIDRLTLMAGVSFPNTPAQNNAFLTYGATYQVATNEGQPKVYLGARGVARNTSNLLGVSGAASFPLQSGLELFGDVTILLLGNNTFDRNGNRERRAVYGFGLRYTPMNQSNFDGSFYFMLTNGLGMTTGTSLSPSLGNQPALAIGITFKGRS